MTVVASGMAMSMVYYTRYTIYMIIIIMTCNVYNISAIVIPRIFGWGPACGAGGSTRIIILWWRGRASPGPGSTQFATIQLLSCVLFSNNNNNDFGHMANSRSNSTQNRSSLDSISHYNQILNLFENKKIRLCIRHAFIHLSSTYIQ